MTIFRRTVWFFKLVINWSVITDVNHYIIKEALLLCKLCRFKSLAAVALGSNPGRRSGVRVSTQSDLDLSLFGVTLQGGGSLLLSWSSNNRLFTLSPLNLDTSFMSMHNITQPLATSSFSLHSTRLLSLTFDKLRFSVTNTHSTWTCGNVIQLVQYRYFSTSKLWDTVTSHNTPEAHQCYDESFGECSGRQCSVRVTSTRRETSRNEFMNCSTSSNYRHLISIDIWNRAGVLSIYIAGLQEVYFLQVMGSTRCDTHLSGINHVLTSQCSELKPWEGRRIRWYEFHHLLTSLSLNSRFTRTCVQDWHQ
ncbi:hypothetical protein C0J52_24110 [Blattella germanica]|nr:hypothetical protein C0J52_24110 [Blattella germanica]